jgi:tetratricopeptide (TPR) repeat protein
MRAPLAAGFLLLLMTSPLRAGLYYSGEAFADLPSQWRGFLLDQRHLRTLAVKPSSTTPASPLRQRYEEEASRLAKLARERPLSADEAADLGALHLRLGETTRALEVLRPAHNAHPTHFRLAANLGTAWQMHGDLDQAADALQQAVKLSPGKYQKAEELHLKLVHQRRREGRDAQGLDDLFGVRFVGPSGKYEPGRLAPDQRKVLPADAAGQAQLLGLWLPADARLLWQLAEMANAHGDVVTAAAIMDGCVTEFGLRSPELREHRQLVRAAADARNREGDKQAHEGHAALFKPRSSRPLPGKFDPKALPPVDPTGVNTLPWLVVTETIVERPFRPTFPRFLTELDGRQVEMTGYMQPYGDEQDCAVFMLIEFPVGCWYCEMPELVGIVRVELPDDKTHPYTRGPVRVTGTLSLNKTDPERFLYTIRQANVSDRDTSSVK